MAPFEEDGDASAELAELEESDHTFAQADACKPLPRVFIVAGPSATGKSTVAKAIADTFGLPMVEGDDLHSEESVKKMSHGHPLTDEDRWGWLQRISAASLESAAIPTSPPVARYNREQKPCACCVSTCSSLKKSYRDFLRSLLSASGQAVLRFVFLTASEEVLLQRIEERKGHYMKKNMVRSQILTLEVPKTTDDEGEGEDSEDSEAAEDRLERDCTVIWTDELSQDEVVERGIEVVQGLLFCDDQDGIADGADGELGSDGEAVEDGEEAEEEEES